MCIISMEGKEGEGRVETRGRERGGRGGGVACALYNVLDNN